MQFTIVYQGDLPPNGNAQDQWSIRREVEPQLRKLWCVPPFDEISMYKDKSYQPDNCYIGEKVRDVEFIPCISTKIKMRAELQILLLSASMPGGLIHHGDIDNRLKTLFDALSVPSLQQMPKNPETESDGQVFCLLEDDRLVTRVDVTNDRLLTESDNSRKAMVIIKVHPVASTVTIDNLGIAV